MSMSWTHHLPVLQVILPLLGAPLCMLTRSSRLNWLITVAISWSAFAISLLLARQVWLHGPHHLQHGRLGRPLGASPTTLMCSTRLCC